LILASSPYASYSNLEAACLAVASYRLVVISIAMVTVFYNDSRVLALVGSTL
jgi:hypothetical protein